MMRGFDCGFLGGGQLARMSIQAAQRMGLSCVSLDPADDGPAAQIAPSIVAKLNDVEALTRLFSSCARVTLENEFVPANAIVEALAHSGRDASILIPGIETLALIQDKLMQREAYERAGVPSPKAISIDDDGASAVAAIGFPMVLKARFGGYDGKGTRYAKNADDFEEHKIDWAESGWLAEEFVDFRRELAVMVFRSPQGAGCFPTMETVQVNHVCDLVFPCDANASDIAMAAVEAVDGIGLFGVELFQTKDDKFLVNEIAPRPHNSGHYTLDWGGVSQFDQHIRMTLGMMPAPLDGVPTCMANLLGQQNGGEWRNGMAAAIANDPGIRVHWYGKQESRPGRKMGHLNAVGGDIVDRAKEARKRFYDAWVMKAVTEEGDGAW